MCLVDNRSSDKKKSTNKSDTQQVSDDIEEITLPSKEEKKDHSVETVSISKDVLSGSISLPESEGVSQVKHVWAEPTSETEHGDHYDEGEKIIVKEAKNLISSATKPLDTALSSVEEKTSVQKEEDMEKFVSSEQQPAVKMQQGSLSEESVSASDTKPLTVAREKVSAKSVFKYLMEEERKEQALHFPVATLLYKCHLVYCFLCRLQTIHYTKKTSMRWLSMKLSCFI